MCEQNFNEVTFLRTLVARQNEEIESLKIQIERLQIDSEIAAEMYSGVREKNKQLEQRIEELGENK